MYDITRKEVNNLKNLLVSQTTKELTKLNSCGDILIELLHKDKLSNYDKTIISYLSVQFDNLQEIISSLDVAILNCYDDKELLVSIIPYLNDTSFMVASFIGKVMELKERV